VEHPAAHRHERAGDLHPVLGDLQEVLHVAGQEPGDGQFGFVRFDIHVFRALL
jgi:hypothetical protein